MKIYICLSAFFLFTTLLFAQVPYNTAIPNGYTKKKLISEQVGLTQVTISYHGPSVNGREGKIWGGIVHKGFVNQGFGNGKPAPWRAGANENTTIEFDHDVKVEGRTLAKGVYGFFIAYDPQESTLIFSKRSDAWGSFFYDESEDALRVKVKPEPVEKNVEILRFEFSGQTINAAVITLLWEKLSIPFRVDVDYLKQQFEALIVESQNPGGFTSQGLNIAAGWCLENNYQLEKALEWANLASGNTFPGDPSSFSALITKAGILEKMGRSPEAATVIETALPFGNISQLQQFGKQLITAKNPVAALEVFKYNYDKNPVQFITLTGMARGLSANGDYIKALEFANKALALAPNDPGKQAVITMIDKLKAGRDINKN